MASGDSVPRLGYHRSLWCPHPRTSTTRTSGDVYRILASSGSEEALVRFLGARLLQIAKDIGLTVNDLLKNR